MGWHRVRRDWAFNSQAWLSLMPLWASPWAPSPKPWEDSASYSSTEVTGRFRWPQALVPNTRGKGWGWLNFRVPTVVLQLCLRDTCICMDLCVCTQLCTCPQAGSISRVLYTWSFWRPILLDEQLFYLTRNKVLWYRILNKHAFKTVIIFVEWLIYKDMFKNLTV